MKNAKGRMMNADRTIPSVGVSHSAFYILNSSFASHHSRHLERRSDFLHFGVVLFFRLLRGILNRRENRIRDELGVFFQKFRIEHEREEFARTVDLEFHRAAAARDLDLFCFELGLERLDLTLHFLGLFEEFTDTGHGIIWVKSYVCEAVSRSQRRQIFKPQVSRGTRLENPDNADASRERL